jgi:hypothetical protein
MWSLTVDWVRPSWRPASVKQAELAAGLTDCSHMGLSMAALSSAFPMTVNVIRGVPDGHGFSYDEDKPILPSSPP